MAYRKRFAGRIARWKARTLYRRNKRKSKRSILKKFSNFVGRTTFQRVKRKRRYYR